jgi:hypothetical protein
MASRPNIHAKLHGNDVTIWTKSTELESYADVSLAADRTIHGGEVWRQSLDRYPGPSRYGLGVGIISLPRKNSKLRKRGWGRGAGPAKGAKRWRRRRETKQISFCRHAQTKLYHNEGRAMVSTIETRVVTLTELLTQSRVFYIQGVTGGTDQTSGGCSLC